MLQWTSSGNTAQGYKVMRSTTSGGPYTTIYSSTTYTLPQYTDASVSNGATYYYVVAANNQAGTSANSVQVSAKPLAAGALPAGWTHQDVGTVLTAGSATYAAVADNTFVVQGSGSDIGGTADSFQFAYQTITGDCTIIARVSNATLSDSAADKVGIMIRESTSSGARTVAMTLGETGFRGARLKIRGSTGGSMTSTYGDDYTYLPVWFMLRRVGNTIIGYQSPDGITWYQVGLTIVSMSSTALVGLVVCSRSSTGELTTATFDHVTIVNSSSMASSVVGRYIFYSNSKFDAASDDNAIATDKQALLPGQTATFANYTSYSQGINGIMVDIAGLVNPAPYSRRLPISNQHRRRLDPSRASVKLLDGPRGWRGRLVPRLHNLGRRRNCRRVAASHGFGQCPHGFVFARRVLLRQPGGRVGQRRHGDCRGRRRRFE